MRVLHTIPDISIESGGTTTSTYELIKALRKVPCDVDILTLKSKVGGHIAGNGEEWIHAIPNDSIIAAYSYSRNFKKALRESDYDIYHTNGIWMYPDHITSVIAREKKKKSVITLHGMLYPQAMRRSRIKKSIFWNLMFKNDVMYADCLHATCQQELENLRNLGCENPIAVIPNLIPISPDLLPATANNKKAFSIGFLGRLHPIKKIEEIFRAVACSGLKDSINVIIMGKGDDEYEMFLIEEAKRLNVKADFRGFVDGEEKYEILKGLSLLCVPSDMENFGMTIPEALICGTPVYASLGTPWQLLEDNRCGWWRDNRPETIALIIKELYAKTPQEIVEMGLRGRKLVERCYSADIVANQMYSLYAWLMGTQNKPDFVYDGK